MLSRYGNPYHGSAALVFITGKQKEIKAIEKKELCFICLSGLAAAGVLLITAGTVLLAII